MRLPTAELLMFLLNSLTLSHLLLVLVQKVAGAGAYVAHFLFPILL